VIISSVSIRYAKALMAIGIKNNRYEGYRADLESIDALLKEHRELKDYLESPLHDEEALKNILKKIGKQLTISPIVMSMLCFLVDNKRIQHLPEIVQAYQEIVDAVSGKVKAIITTASDISSDLVTPIKSALEKVVHQEVYLQFEKDPEIIGGVVAKIGDMVYDGSLKTQLEKIKYRLIRGTIAYEN